jgi:hypothetical protein
MRSKLVGRLSVKSFEEGACASLFYKNIERFIMNTRHFSQLPKPYLAYPKVIQGLIFKKPKGEKVLPQVEYVVDT